MYLHVTVSGYASSLKMTIAGITGMEGEGSPLSRGMQEWWGAEMPFG